jgi:hypothetical protein
MVAAVAPWRIEEEGAWFEYNTTRMAMSRALCNEDCNSLR